MLVERPVLVVLVAVSVLLVLVVLVVVTVLLLVDVVVRVAVQFALQRPRWERTSSNFSSFFTFTFI